MARVVFVLVLVAAVIHIPLKRVRERPLSPLLLANSAVNATTLKNYQNVRITQMQYSGVVYVGSPPQQFSLIFSTSSSVTPK